MVAVRAAAWVDKKSGERYCGVMVESGRNSLLRLHNPIESNVRAGSLSSITLAGTADASEDAEDEDPDEMEDLGRVDIRMGEIEHVEMLWTELR